MEAKKSNRGFASMEPNKQREIARKGGRSVPGEKAELFYRPRPCSVRRPQGRASG